MPKPSAGSLCRLTLTRGFLFGRFFCWFGRNWFSNVALNEPLGSGFIDIDKDASIIWEGHNAGRDIGYCHLEKMHNLEALPDFGFTVSCFPHKVRGGSAGWTRAVAIIDEH